MSNPSLPHFSIGPAAFEHTQHEALSRKAPIHQSLLLLLFFSLLVFLTGELSEVVGRATTASTSFLGRCDETACLLFPPPFALLLSLFSLSSSLHSLELRSHSAAFLPPLHPAPSSSSSFQKPSSPPPAQWEKGAWGGVSLYYSVACSDGIVVRIESRGGGEEGGGETLFQTRVGQTSKNPRGGLTREGGRKPRGRTNVTFLTYSLHVVGMCGLARTFPACLLAMGEGWRRPAPARSVRMCGEG